MSADLDQEPVSEEEDAAAGVLAMALRDSGLLGGTEESETPGDAEENASAEAETADVEIAEVETAVPDLAVETPAEEVPAEEPPAEEPDASAEAATDEDAADDAQVEVSEDVADVPADVPAEDASSEGATEAVDETQIQRLGIQKPGKPRPTKSQTLPSTSSRRILTSCLATGT